MIPKKIHYCWFGNNKKSKLIIKCINSWKKIYPECEIIEWNENNFDVNCNNYVSEAYRNKKWAFVSDYARLWIIYNYGGIYLDTDVELIKKNDDLFKYDGFFCFEDNFIATGLGFGACKNNKIIKKMMDDYENIHFSNNGVFDLQTCPIRNTNSIKNELKKIDFNKLTIKNNIIFFPTEYFCPLDYKTGELKITKNTIAIHWYGASWLDNKNKIKKVIKKILIKIIGKNNFLKLKKGCAEKNE